MYLVYLISKYLKFVVMSSDSNVYVISLLVWIALSLFLAPLTFVKGIEDDLKICYFVNIIIVFLN